MNIKTEQFDLRLQDNMELMKEFEDNHFDLAIVDPPYFDGPQKLGYYGGNTSKSGVVRKGYKKIGSWQLPDKKYFLELKRVSRHQIVWGINYYPKYIDNVGRIVWDKVNGDSSFSDCEIASCSYHDSVRLFKFMWNGMMQGKGIVNGNIQEGNKSLNEKRIHPTQKPVKLYEWIIAKYAKKGDKLLDTHIGSGSIAIAIDKRNKLEKMNLHLTGCELDEEYFKALAKRIQEQTAQNSIF